MPSKRMPIPSVNSHSTPFEDGAEPPVSGGSGVAVGGTDVGNGAGTPSLPTATEAGSELRLPHTSVPSLLRRIEAGRMVSEPSLLMATSAKSEMFVRIESGSGTQTFAAPLRAYDEMLASLASTTETAYMLPSIV